MASVSFIQSNSPPASSDGSPPSLKKRGGLAFKLEDLEPPADSGVGARRAVLLTQPISLGSQVRFSEPAEADEDDGDSERVSPGAGRQGSPGKLRSHSFQQHVSRRKSISLCKRYGRNPSRPAKGHVMYGGMLSDYLYAFYRQRSKSPTIELRNCDQLFRWYRKELGADSDSYASSDEDDSQEEEKQAKEEKIDKTFACRFAVRDKLMQILQRELLIFWGHAEERSASKSSASAASAKRRPGAPMPKETMKKAMQLNPLQAEFKEVLAGLRESRCLETEINNLLTRRRLLSVPATCGESEDHDAKLETHQNFWKIYHRDENKLSSERHSSNSSNRMLPMISGFAGAVTTSVGQKANADQEREQPSATPNVSGLLPSQNRPASKSRPGSRLRPSSKQRPNSKLKQRSDDLHKSSRTTSARMLVGHRHHIHQKRIHRTNCEIGDEASVGEDDLTVEKRVRLQLPRMKELAAASPASSDDEGMDRPVSQGHFLDVGGFLDPMSRQIRSRQMKGWTDKYRHVHENSGAKAVGRSHMQSIAVLPPVAMAQTFTSGMIHKSASDGALRNMQQMQADVPDRLPPVFGLSGPFKVPWRGGGQIHKQVALKSNNVEADAGTATQKYISACHQCGVVPTPAALRMAETGKLTGADKNLFDDDLFALAAMVPQLERLHSVDLSGNTCLSDSVLTIFLKTLFTRSVAGSLDELDLSQCKGMARSSIAVSISLLGETDGIYRLQHLNLSGVLIPSMSYMPLSTAIRNHATLKSVKLADTGLGQHPAVRQCVSEIFGAPGLELVDLGWNSFPVDVFELIGNAVCNNKKLKTLRLASCSGFPSAPGESPVIYFLESLSHNEKLQLLDISLNQIDSQGALVLEDALEYHRGVTELLMSENPLGRDGVRSVLRLLSKQSSGLLHFDCSFCYGHPGVQPFNATDPSGKYEVNLGTPYGRALMRMLYKACENFNLKPDRAFVDVHYLVPPRTKGSSNARGSPAKATVPTAWKHPQAKDNSGIWCVPATGVLTFHFTIDDALGTYFTSEDTDGKPTDVFFKDSVLHSTGDAGRKRRTLFKSSLMMQSDWRTRLPPLLATNYLEQISALVRIKPGFNKIVPLLAQFAKFKGQAQEQRLLIDALSHDFSLSFAHVAQLCRSRSRTVKVLPKLVQCVSGGSQRFLTMAQATGLEEYLSVFSSCQRYLLFNPENATGHYVLTLSNPSDFAVAEQLRLLDRWEAMMARRRGCMDFSMHGNWSGFRNIYFNPSPNQNESIQNVTTWHLPAYGSIEFDYSSWRRPPNLATCLDTQTWNTLLLQLAMASCRNQDKLTSLHHVSDQFFVTAVQLRELLGSFANRKERLSVITTFAFRLIDPQNMKIARSRLGDVDEKLEMRIRLGMLPLFPFFQPEDSVHHLDLAIYEGRTAAALAIQMAVKERLENIRHPSLELLDGSYYNFTMGTPVSWEHVENLPKGGQLKFRYVCAPEDRKVKLRRELGVKYGGWRTDIHTADSDTVWWSALSEAPEVVLELMYCIVRQYSDVFSCFTKLGALNSWHGRASLSQLKTSLELSGHFPKFLKHPEKLKAAFRYLDPDESGSISVAEWGALHQLWKELKLSILEFLQFVDRTFAGNFNLVWEELDVDGSEEIDLEEWQEGVRFVGYFGESTPIFNFLCDEKVNMITKKSWQKVHSMWVERDTLRKRIFLED